MIHLHIEVWIGQEKSGQVRTGVKYYFSSTGSPTLFKFGPSPNLRAVSWPYLAGNPTTLRSGGIRASSPFSWRKVWNGVKCIFSSPHQQGRKIVGKPSIRRVRMWNFTRIGPKTKKLWLLIVPVQRPSEQLGLGPPQKGVNCNFSWPQFDKPYGVRELSTSDAQICSFSRIAQKIKKLQLF